MEPKFESTDSGKRTKAEHLDIFVTLVSFHLQLGRVKNLRNFSGWRKETVQFTLERLRKYNQFLGLCKEVNKA